MVASRRSLAFANLGICGQALVTEGRLVHLAAHQKCLGQSRPLADLLPSLDAVRSEWEDQRPPYMDNLAEDYARRRRRYNAFKSKLHPFSPSEPAEHPSDILTADETDTAPPPRPLNPALHQFFLRLFSRH